jgi:hypothetical protein
MGLGQRDRDRGIRRILGRPILWCRGWQRYVHHQDGKTLSEHEPFRFNPHNAVTGGFERTTSPEGLELVTKTLVSSRDDAPTHWAASADPRHWNYWRREAEAYTDEEHRAGLSDTGISMPQAEIEDHGSEISLHLELIEGISGTEFDIEQHASFANALGRWQAHERPESAWTSRRFLRTYSGSKPSPFELIDDDRAWQQPLIARHWPESLRDGWRRLIAARPRLLSIAERLPRRRCHLDAWASNVIARHDGGLSLVDWSFCGDGTLGEDIGNHVPDGVFDLFWPPTRLEELESVCFDAYCGGLRAKGWTGDDRLVRLGMTASAVKYTWLLPLQLTAAGSTKHFAYHQPADPDVLYAARGAGLAHLVRWCDEALLLADKLGY